MPSRPQYNPGFRPSLKQRQHPSTISISSPSCAMNASDYRRHRIQPTILPSVSGDASNTVADQLPQDLNPNNPQYYANTAHQSHPSSFLRPSRPGESANTLILPSQTHSLRHRPIQQHYHSGTDIFRPDNGSSSADTQLHLIDANLGSPVTPQVPNMGTSSIASGMRGNDDFQSLQFPDQQVLQQESTSIELQQPTGTSNKLLNSQKMVPNPPDLESWREKLFNVDGTITLTEGQYVHTYLPMLSIATSSSFRPLHYPSEFNSKYLYLYTSP